MSRSLVMGCLVLVVALSGCGPMIGQMMRATTGVKEFKVTEGSLADFRSVNQVVVFAPFEKDDTAYFLCHGEDEANLAQELQRAKLYTTSFYMEREYGKGPQALAALRQKTPAELQSQLKLAVAPDAILSGRLLARDETVAPTYGMIQALRLRLDLYNLRTRQTASIEMSVKELHQQTISLIVSELKKRMEKS